MIARSCGFDSHPRYNDRLVNETVVKSVLREISLSTFFMSNILELLCTEYENVYGLKMKKKYSNPVIYHGGDDYDLTKRWYVYYSYRHPETGKSVWASSFFKAFIKLEVWRSFEASPEII